MTRETVIEIERNVWVTERNERVYPGGCLWCGELLVSPLGGTRVEVAGFMRTAHRDCQPELLEQSND